MTSVQLYCETCGAEAKRPLIGGVGNVGCRGTHESACEPASCPHGHGLMVRRDGVVQTLHGSMWVVTGRAS